MGVAYNKVALVVVVCMVVCGPAAEAAITCGAVSKGIAGCIPYLKGGAGPSPACCAGVRMLSSSAKSPADHKVACGCLKQGAAAIKGINYNVAAGLPGKCGVSVPFPISPNTDCSKIH